MEKPQIIFVHGGTAFPDREAFLAYLKTAEPREPFWSQDEPTRWRETIARRFAGSCEIMMPSMPNKQNARYDEWSLWFERHIPFLRDGVILIGHSMGGIFLAKYLAEHIFPVRVGALVLVAAPFEDESLESLGDFVLPECLDGVARQAERIILYYSKDDPVVLSEEMGRYVRAFPEAETSVLDDRGHFLTEDFPELSERITKILG